jgi:pimeloyl-ACP methyl ester carboxylesterase
VADRDVPEDVPVPVPPSRTTDQGGSLALTAADGVRLSAHHDPPAGGSPDGTAVVLGHGFTGTWRRPEVRAIARGLAATGSGVVSLDFRGHGASGGCTTLGRDEVLDVAAAVARARALGYRRVATLGFSMGAGIVVRHGALYRDDAGAAADAVVAVSGPSRWNYRGTRPMRVVHALVNTAAGRRLLAARRGTRVCGADRQPAPEPPDAVAGRIAPVPLLVVHGDADHYFPLDHARWLARAAGPTATLWELPGFGHAESAVTPDLTRRIARWVTAAVAAGGPEGAAESARIRT